MPGGVVGGGAFGPPIERATRLLTSAMTGRNSIVHVLPDDGDIEQVLGYLDSKAYSLVARTIAINDVMNTAMWGAAGGAAGGRSSSATPTPG